MIRIFLAQNDSELLGTSQAEASCAENRRQREFVLRWTKDVLIRRDVNLKRQTR